MTVLVHLARAWRPRTFNELIGQDLTVKILKNSLYKDIVFPVYLLSGQRGSGKTTTGRLFAGALNCARLADFQQHPQEIDLPCLACASCEAMKMGAHPDFFEIDAASYTGVDNVRQIIEAASFLPILGTRKIYLIDEAHMLSKAAFNAFLKILEEPPKSVVFLLATTEVTKIIDTVRSRCFNLFFDPIATPHLTKHLVYICQQESLEYDELGLSCIAAESQGSVRDALNLIERVRLAHGSVTMNAVTKVLGLPQETIFLELFAALSNNSAHDVLAITIKYDFSLYNPTILWKKIVEYVRMLLSIVCNVPCEIIHEKQLVQLAHTFSQDQLTRFLEILYTSELHYVKTLSAPGLMELVLLKMLEIKNSSQNIVHNVHTPPSITNKKIAPAPVVQQVTPEQTAPIDDPWKYFLHELQAVHEPLVNSIFRQGQFRGKQHKEITIAFSSELIFFKDSLESTRLLWQPILEKCFEPSVVCTYIFTAEIKSPAPILQKKAEPISQQRSYKITHDNMQKKPVAMQEQKINNSHLESLPRAQSVLQVFPGTLTEIKENNHE
ncbi:MAG: DNA polymerase III subunit gamma/tau [Candidatus Babeliaceae bacterium]|jgi:DNA polymerase-3 subunit gamma/tau